MSDSPLFKRAFVRGLNAELMRQGVVHFPSKHAADQAADYVADNYCPDPVTNGSDITMKVAHTLCEQLHAAGDHLCKEAGDRYMPALNKTASVADPQELALVEAWQVMEKAAAETGSIYEGGDATNDMPAGAQNSGESAQEQNRRPENYANLGEGGVGGYERKGEGSVGTEEKHPEAPAATDGGSNSATENSAKHGSLADIVAKVAGMGSLMDPGKNQNDMPAAAAVQGEAAQEQNRRPENYANKGESGVGRSDMVPGAEHQVGREQPHPEAPAATDSGKTNVPLEHTKSAFDQLFEDTARQVVPFLPESMPDNHKVAHVRATMGLETEKRAEYIHTMWTALNPTAADSIKEHFLKSAEEVCDEGKEYPMTEKKEDELPPALKAKKIPEGSDADGDGETNEKSASAQQALSSLRDKLAAISQG